MSLLRASLLGGVDGVITSFAIVAGVHAGGLGRRAVWVVGVSSLVADGVSMGVSEYLSRNSERAAAPDTGPHPAVSGLACFASFLACGFVPLAASNASLLSSAAFSLVVLMLLGVARTRVTREAPLYGLAETAALGAVAGGISYAVAAGVHGTY